MDEFKQRCITALTANGTQTSADVANLLSELEAAIVAAEDTAKLEHERSLDPSISRDAKLAPATAEDAAFRVGRLKTLLPRLRKRYHAVLGDEQEDEAWTRAEPIIAQRDALAKEFREVYPEGVNKLLDLFERMGESNEEIARFHRTLPEGLLPTLNIREAEVEARKLVNGYTRNCPSILKTTVLPDLDGTRLWPPHSPGLTIFSTPVPYNPRHSPEWGVQLEQQQRQKEIDDEAAAKQHADEARERQRESGGPVWWEGERR
jgi:hypothetical protein